MLRAELSQLPITDTRGRLCHWDLEFVPHQQIRPRAGSPKPSFQKEAQMLMSWTPVQALPVLAVRLGAVQSYFAAVNPQ